jgi:hypothetical protein
MSSKILEESGNGLNLDLQRSCTNCLLHILGDVGYSTKGGGYRRPVYLYNYHLALLACFISYEK